MTGAIAVVCAPLSQVQRNHFASKQSATGPGHNSHPLSGATSSISSRPAARCRSYRNQHSFEPGRGTLELNPGLHQLMTDYSSVGPREQASSVGDRRTRTTGPFRHSILPLHRLPSLQNRLRIAFYILCQPYDFTNEDDRLRRGRGPDHGSTASEQEPIMLRQTAADRQFRVWCLMAPLGTTYCCWSDGLLHYQAKRPGAGFHIHFSQSLSKTLNDFPKEAKRPSPHLQHLGALAKNGRMETALKRDGSPDVAAASLASRNERRLQTYALCIVWEESIQSRGAGSRKSPSGAAGGCLDPDASNMFQINTVLHPALTSSPAT
ncbi:hypothetical protein EYF80_036507 [Liparis tanakae]|uniref:Uncharacterized protein n=1 Tax=Liparis tanakae TaxID=230148 RepID=A0A4Z2GK96_9TELE|nr:hypothetical protein EYF80_036507 [Liparis tanakae]